jgi:hypothetical protein
MPSLDTLYNRKENELKVKKVFTGLLADLYIEPGFNIRFGEITADDVSPLRSAYLSGRPIPPIVVEIQPDGRMKIIAGHRRHKALSLLVAEGYEQFSRVELRHIDTDAASVVQYMVGENGHGRTNLNAVDLSIACQKLSELGNKPSQIASLLSFGESKVVYHLTIAKMSDEVKQAIIDGKIAADLAAEIFRKSGDAGVMSVIGGAEPGKKVTRAGANLWRPSMGKSVVSLLSGAAVHITDSNVSITVSTDEWERIKEAVEALGVKA